MDKGRQLREQIKADEERIEVLKAEVAEAKEKIRVKVQQNTSLSSDLQDVKDKEAEIEAKYKVAHRAEQELPGAQKAKEELEEQVKRLKVQFKNACVDLKTVRDDLHKSEQRTLDLEKLAQAFKAEKEDVDGQIDVLEDEVHDIKKKYDALVSSLDD